MTEEQLQQQENDFRNIKSVIDAAMGGGMFKDIDTVLAVNASYERIKQTVLEYQESGAPAKKVTKKP